MSAEVLHASTGDDIGFGGVDVTPPALARTPKENATIYDQLRDEFNRPAIAEPITLAVPNRSSIKVIFDPNIDFDTMKAYYKAATDKKVLDTMRLAIIVVQQTMIGIVMNGQPVMDKEGDPMTIASQEMLEMFKVDNPTDALRKLYGSDGHIMAASYKIMQEAGYNYDTDDLEDEDGPKF